jgi:hypothetical protein
VDSDTKTPVSVQGNLEIIEAEIGTIRAERRDLYRAESGTEWGKGTAAGAEIEGSAGVVAAVGTEGGAGIVGSGGIEVAAETEGNTVGAEGKEAGIEAKGRPSTVGVEGLLRTWKGLPSLLHS